jgi:hypothetical protein
LIDSIHSRVPQAEALGAGMLARNLGPNAPIDEPR